MICDSQMHLEPYWWFVMVMIHKLDMVHEYV